MLTEYSYMYMHEPHTDLEEEMEFLDDLDLDAWLEMEYEDRHLEALTEWMEYEGFFDEDEDEEDET